MHILRTLFSLLLLPILSIGVIAQDFSRVPGTIIAHSPASTGVYLGSPAITPLSDSIYVATHDIFGKVGGTGFDTYIYRSIDRGDTWKQISMLPGQRWSSLHVLHGALYMIGVHGVQGNGVIRKSMDGGVTWTEPTEPANGLLVRGDSSAQCHCAPVPLLVHNGHVWRAMELYDPHTAWGSFRSFVMSAPIGGELLNAGTWTFSNALPHPGRDIPGTTWLEGNIILTPDNRLVNILRCHTETDNIACVLSVSEDGRTVALDSQMPTIALPGACKKFTIRYDAQTRRYWSLTNYPFPRYLGINHVERTRNAVVLVSSHDLRSWQIHRTVLEHTDVKRTGFQYLDWFFEGNDLVVLSRTAFDDGLGGAHDCHDANLVTFHRVKEFRQEASDPSDNDSALTARARELAQRLTIIDTHIDLPSILAERWHDVSVRNSRSNFDYVRAQAGGLDVPFLAVYIPSRLEGTPKSEKHAEGQIAAVRRMVAEWPDKFDLVYSPADIPRKSRPGKILLAMGMENGAPLQGDLSNLAYFHSLGIRYITLAHAKWNHICDASYDPVRHWNGLSPFGRQVVEEMNRLGMMVDISHLTDSAAIQAIRLSRAPVIASHSSCRAFTPGFERNMSDELIIALAQKGGTIQISFASEFVNDSVRYAYMRTDSAVADSVRKHGWEPGSQEARLFKRKYLQQHLQPFATLEDVAAHIDHVRKLVGIDFVGIGSDFDGVGDTLPDGLKDVSGYPNLIAALLRRGYTEADIAKVCGGNFLRVWAEVERVARN